jgi:hypothetical protein
MLPDDTAFREGEAVHPENRAGSATNLHGFPGISGTLIIDEIVKSLFLPRSTEITEKNL